jgi:hypothetical protein
MTLELKNKRIDELTIELTQLSGRPVEEVVERLMGEEVNRLKRGAEADERVRRVLKIAEDSRPRFKLLNKDRPYEDPAAFLYDEETGLPR